MFRVEWLESVVDQLANSWLDANPQMRQSITAAAHQIDQELCDDPSNHGESRDRSRRIHFVKPLSVTYEVDTQKRLVTVLHICVYKPRR